MQQAAKSAPLGSSLLVAWGRPHSSSSTQRPSTPQRWLSPAGLRASDSHRQRLGSRGRTWQCAQLGEDIAHIRARGVAVPEHRVVTFTHTHTLGVVAEMLAPGAHATPRLQAQAPAVAKTSRRTSRPMIKFRPTIGLWADRARIRAHHETYQSVTGKRQGLQEHQVRVRMLE